MIPLIGLLRSPVAKKLGTLALALGVGSLFFLGCTAMLSSYRTTAQKLIATELAAKRAAEISAAIQKSQQVQYKQLEDTLAAVKFTLDRRAVASKELENAFIDIKRIRQENGPSSCPTDPVIVHAVMRASRNSGHTNGSAGAVSTGAGQGASQLHGGATKPRGGGRP